MVHGGFNEDLRLVASLLEQRIDQLAHVEGDGGDLADGGQPAGVEQAAGDTEIAAAARKALHGALRTLDAKLDESRYLLGRRLTLADVRLWVTLVRFGPGLREYPALRRYTRELLEREDFRTRGASQAAVAQARPRTGLPFHAHASKGGFP